MRPPTRWNKFTIVLQGGYIYTYWEGFTQTIEHRTEHKFHLLLQALIYNILVHHKVKATV